MKRLKLVVGIVIERPDFRLRAPGLLSSNWRTLTFNSDHEINRSCVKWYSWGRASEFKIENVSHKIENMFLNVKNGAALSQTKNKKKY